MTSSAISIELDGAAHCVRCVMNSFVDRNLVVDPSGICNHCRRYESLVASRTVAPDQREQALARLVDRIKADGRGKEYDCIVGVSGGVDSTYVAYLAKSLGLRPLAVHFDNGWNSELAVGNIQKVLDRLSIELYTYVVDWEEFRSLQLAFLRASTPDGEIPTDHAIQALLWRKADEFGVRYILSGMNFATEAFSIPEWAYGHSDWTYIEDVNRRFGQMPLKTYPHYTLTYLLYLNAVRRIKTVSILNYVNYDKAKAIELLQQQLGWTAYGGKHYESIYTRFFQGYILPRKFGIDKRYGHLCDLINAGQMTREAALSELQSPPFPEAMAAQDREYVIKKFGISSAEFDAIMAAPPRSFRDFRNQYAKVQALRGMVNRLRGWGLYSK
jgi:N-acetyl sugar amidotransferase